MLLRHQKAKRVRCPLFEYMELSIIYLRNLNTQILGLILTTLALQEIQC